MTGIERLEAAFRVVLEEARSNGQFRSRLKAALALHHAEPTKRRNRRAPASLDPFEVFSSEGETGLRAALQKLDIELLKDIVAEFSMDRDRLAMKWKTPGRLIDRIVETVVARDKKGDAFLKG